ncbi:MAG: hypothetical protein IJW20_01525 [Clostridia bacterium]|nr:hypothetical protein [Clostridia bacterium]
MEIENSLEELYYNYENKLFEKLERDERYLKLSELAEESEDNVRKRFNKDIKRMLSDCMDLNQEKGINMMRVGFKYGFSLANSLMVESLNDNKKKSK